jgi:predicted small lipoprotein YifL
MHTRLACVAVVLAALLAGCGSLGPLVLPRDRFDYSSAISESWKYQTLLNVVKLRYMDTPIFIDVAQVVSGYQLVTQLNAGGSVTTGTSLLGRDVANFGASGQYTDRPTITYTPLTGDQYVRGIMTPLRPESLFFAVLAGWPADAIFFTSVVSINGLANQRFGGMYQQSGDPKFFRLMSLIHKLQKTGAIGFRIKEGKEKGTSNLLFFRKDNLTQEELQNIQEAKQLLGLNPNAHEYNLVFGPSTDRDTEVAMQTRSLIQIMQEVGAQVDLPDEDIVETRATPGFVEQTGEQKNIRFMRIHSSKSKSDAAGLSIKYRDHWFWIDDRDIETKRNFAFLMYLFSLADTGAKQPLPLITIPAQ